MTRYALRFSALVLALAAPGAASADPPAPTAAEAEADRAVHRGEMAGRRLLAMLGERRALGDQARARCLDDKLTQVNAFSRAILERRARLRRAEASGDTQVARYERRVIQRLAAQLTDLEEDGRACVIPRRQSDGRTIVTMTVDPHAPRVYR